MQMLGIIITWVVLLLLTIAIKWLNHKIYGKNLMKDANVLELDNGKSKIYLNIEHVNWRIKYITAVVWIGGSWLMGYAAIKISEQVNDFVIKFCVWTIVLAWGVANIFIGLYVGTKVADRNRN